MNLKNSPFKIVHKGQPVGSEKRIIKIPTSKSYANRILILASLVEAPIEIHDIPLSTDVLMLIECLKQIGLKIEENIHEKTGEKILVIKNHFPACECRNEKAFYLNTGDGGTTNRFLLPMLALGKNTYFLSASHRMLTRPMDEIISCLKDLKVQVTQDCSNHKKWMQVKGPIIHNNQTIKVDCSRSTQFASGLRLIFWQQDNVVIPENIKTSEDYYKITEVLCRKATEGTKIFVVPPDSSSASYPIAWAALNGEVLIENIKEIDELQADSCFIKLLEESGVGISLDENGLLIKNNSKLKPLKVNCEKFPDLILTLVYYLSYVDGVSELSHLKVLEFKESNRLEEILKLLKIFGVKHHYDESKDLLIIHGDSQNITEEKIDIFPPPDHRVIMVSYLFLKHNSGGNLYNFHHVKKSFPNFFLVLD